MFCPICHGEYRKGITTCATCDVALVAEVRGPAPADFTPEAPATAALAAAETMAEYCGFLSLDEARQARETLRGERIDSEILIRDALTEDPGARPAEEYWLRVPVGSLRVVARILGEDEIEEEKEESAPDLGGAVACSDCGKPVGEDEAACPHCGAQFE